MDWEFNLWMPLFLKNIETSYSCNVGVLGVNCFMSYIKKLCLFFVFWFLFYPLTGYTAQKQEIPVSVKHLHADVQALTSIEPPRNYRNIVSLDRVGAHYDVCGDTPGADDNASGVAAILELARLLAALKPPLKHRVDLVAYCLEEPPFFRTPHMGSAIHARSLAKKKVKVRVMISLDMIGCFSINASPLRPIASFIKPGSVIPGQTTAILSKREEEKITRDIQKYMNGIMKAVTAVALNPPADTPTIDWSDHRNYWKEGYPAVLISNAFIAHNPNYHQPQDTIDTLDFNKMAEIVKGVYAYLDGSSSLWFAEEEDGEEKEEKKKPQQKYGKNRISKGHGHPDETETQRQVITQKSGYDGYKITPNHHQHGCRDKDCSAYNTAPVESLFLCSNFHKGKNEKDKCQ
jgi:hypothetical protein